MNHKTLTLLGGVSATLLMISASGASHADDRYYNDGRYHHHVHRRARYECERDRRHDANNGTIIGALGGGLAGNLLSSGGGKTGGTLIGAGVGAVAGHQIAKNNHRC